MTAKKHIATCASLSDYGSVVGTRYMYTVEDIMKAAAHYEKRNGGMVRFRWRNSECKIAFGPKLREAQREADAKQKD